MTTPTSPRRFRFGLRSLFVMVTVVAVVCAWVAYSLNWIRQRREFLQNCSNDDYRTVPDALVTEGNGQIGPSKLTTPGLLWIFGEPGVWYIDIKDKERIQRAERLFPEAYIVSPIDDTKPRIATPPDSTQQ